MKPVRWTGRRRWLAGLGLVAGIGCGSPAEDTRAPELELRLEARFGSLDGKLSLGVIQALALSQGRGDTVLIAQRFVPSVLVLSAQGDSLGSIGRLGSGPGEFTAIGWMAIQGDTVWIADMNRVISRFTPEGEFLDQMRFPMDPLSASEMGPEFRAPLSDGSLLFTAGYGPGSAAAGIVEAIAHVRVSRSGQVLDTIVRESVSGSSMSIRFDDGSMLMGLHPVDRSDRVAVDPRGRWLVSASMDEPGMDETMAALTWIALGGDTIRTARIQGWAQSTADRRERFIEDLMGWSRGRPRGEVSRVVEEQVPWPSTQPPVRQLVADLDGRVWVGTTSASPDSTRWMVFDPEGGQMGEFLLPVDVQLHAAVDSTVWGSTVGSYDEPYILRFTIVR